MNETFLEYSDPQLANANFVSRTFEDTKTRKKWKLPRSIVHVIISYVQEATSTLVQRIRKLKGVSGKSTINFFKKGHKCER